MQTQKQTYAQRHMQQRQQRQQQTEPHADHDCGGIPCIVRAVRAGDDRLIGTLLQRFAQHAELDCLFRLRDALRTDAGSSPQPLAGCPRA